MKLLLLLFVALSVVAVIAAAAAEDDQSERGLQPSSAKKNFRMPKLFDMGVYMEKFGKKYPNAAELMRRTKLFMARAFSVFVSSIRYMYNQGTKYLKINPRSDWTRAERLASLNNFVAKGRRATKKTDHSDVEPAVDPKDVEELVLDPEYAQLAAQLGESNRKKRHARQRRTLTMEQLTGEAREPSRVSPKYATSVPSNNPDYEQPQLEQFSEGADESSLESKPIPEAEAQKIDQVAALGSYLSGLFNGIKETAMDSQTSWGEKLQLLAGAGSRHRKQKIKLLDDVVTPEEAEAAMDEVMLDYRQTGCLLEPKDQGRCGSCYIFAETALLEWHHCNQTGKLVPFSEQYAVDCGEMSGLEYMEGCDGGVENDVGQFYAQFGLELALDYPYKGAKHSCPYEESVNPKVRGHTKIELIENELLEWAEDGEDNAELGPENVSRLLEEKGPLTVSVITNDEFFDFGGGVDELNCDPDNEMGAHAMVIIGHGREDGIEYYLIRNSHGQDYGLGGHYKMAKQVREGCLARVGWTLAKFKQNRKHRGSPIFNQLEETIRRSPRLHQE